MKQKTAADIYNRNREVNKETHGPIRIMGGRQVQDIYDSQGRFVRTEDRGPVSKKLTRSPIRIVKGRQVRDVIDAQGNITKTEDLGPAEDKEFKPDWIRKADGSYARLKTGEKMPEGAMPVTDTPTLESLYQKDRMEMNLVNTESSINTDEARRDPELARGHIEFFNARNKDYKYEILPEYERFGPNIGSRIARMKPLPVDSVTGKQITMEDVITLAKEKKVKPEEVLKHLGVLIEVLD